MNIGIFDSGIGGVTVLHEAMKLMPLENYIFYADTDHVPYGTKTKEQVIAYVDEVMQFMLAHDCKAVVIACNTATAAAAQLMRERYSIPIIGIEPAVKPAVEKSQGKRIMVIATPLTIREEKLKNLVERVDDTHLVDLLAFPRLVEFAEHNEFSSEELEAYICETLSPYDLSAYSEFVLGCTHFNYFKDSFAKLLPKDAHILDGSLGTVKQLKRILQEKNLLEENEGIVRYFYSGRELVEQKDLQRMQGLHNRLERMREIRA